MQSLSLLIKFI